MPIYKMDGKNDGKQQYGIGACAMYCKHCGKPIDADSKFCIWCGKQVCSEQEIHPAQIEPETDGLKIESGEVPETPPSYLQDSYSKMKRNVIWYQFNQKTALTNTKWMYVFVKCLIPLWCFTMPIFAYGSMYQVQQTYYLGDWTLYFSQPACVFLVVTLLIKYSCVISMFYYLKRLSTKGLVALYAFTATWICELVVSLANQVAAQDIILVVLSIPNTVYFFKRRNLFER